MVDTGTLKRLREALLRYQPPVPQPLMVTPPPQALMAPVPPSPTARVPEVPLRSGRRRHARTSHRRRHRGAPAHQGRRRLVLLVALPAAGTLGLLLPLLR